MKISYNWLKEYINLDISAQETADRLTDAGLEVEAVHMVSVCTAGPAAGRSVTGGLEGCVIGEVVTKEKHPDADRLSVTTVNIGEKVHLNIVCGAPNVAAGQKVIVAKVGTTIYPTNGDPLTLRKAKIRGAVSEGMICAEDELGLGTSHAGIMVLEQHAIPGTPASDFFKLDTDHILEIGLTPNRADAASHIGVAKDLVAILNSKLSEDKYFLQIPPLEEVDVSAPPLKINVSVEAAESCIRYMGLTISGVQVKESPDWLKSRLNSIGLTPINNIVDITNFVLHETGQPLHAFDAGNIEGKKVVVKKLEDGTKFTTLDAVERKLSSDDLMICSAKAPMCIAGVFGGKDSGISPSTKDIFLESACFEPGTVRRSSKRHGLKTDASFRFERGTDPNLPPYALERAAQLITRLAGGHIASDVFDYYPNPVKEKKIALSFHHCYRLIGKKIPHQEIQRILELLDMKIIEGGQDALVVAVPTNKTDVTVEADLIEEVLRIYGFNNVETPNSLKSNLSYTDPSDHQKKLHALSNYLTGHGFNEIMNNSLSDHKLLDLTPNGAEQAIFLENPLSPELSILRTNIIWGGLESIAWNHNRKNHDLKLFETGKSYRRHGDKIVEKFHLCLLLTGNRSAESWSEKSKPTDLFVLKGVVEGLLQRIGLDSPEIKEISTDVLASGIAYSIGGKNMAEIGFVKKNFLKHFEIKMPVFAAIFDLDALFQSSANNKIRYKEVLKFPEVRRDLALIVDKKVKYELLKDLAFKTEKKILKEVNLFDVYEGDKIGQDKKSYALSFILANEESTLTDKEVDQVMSNLVKNFQEKAGAAIRS